MLTKMSKALRHKGLRGCAYGFKSRHSDQLKTLENAENSVFSRVFLIFSKLF